MHNIFVFICAFMQKLFSSLGQHESLDPPPRVSSKMPVEGVSDVLWNKGGKNLNQRRDIFRGDQPDALDQDFSIFMSKDIPQSHHSSKESRCAFACSSQTLV